MSLAAAAGEAPFVLAAAYLIGALAAIEALEGDEQQHARDESRAASRFVSAHAAKLDASGKKKLELAQRHAARPLPTQAQPAPRGAPKPYYEAMMALGNALLARTIAMKAD